VRFGQVSYPVSLKHGETWSGQVKFKHAGPAETVRVRMALYVAATYQWSEYASVDVGRDETEQEYTAVVSGTYDSKGLLDYQTIDTKMEMVDSTGRVWQDTSTVRFNNQSQWEIYPLFVKCGDVIPPLSHNPSGEWAVFQIYDPDGGLFIPEQRESRGSYYWNYFIGDLACRPGWMVIIIDRGPHPPNPIILHGINIPAGARYWQLIVEVSGINQWNVVGAPSELSIDTANPMPEWKVLGKYISGLLASYTWASWPPVEPYASSFWGPAGSSGPIQLYYPLEAGAAYEFDFATGIVTRI